MRRPYASSLTNILGAFPPINGTGSHDKPGIEYRVEPCGYSEAVYIVDSKTYSHILYEMLSLVCLPPPYLFIPSMSVASLDSVSCHRQWWVVLVANLRSFETG
jgi:hypothetical protein